MPVRLKSLMASQVGIPIIFMGYDLLSGAKFRA